MKKKEIKRIINNKIEDSEDVCVKKSIFNFNKKIIILILCTIAVSIISSIITIVILKNNTSKMYSVTFFYNNEIFYVYDNILEGNKIELPPSPIKDGYNFIGWYDDEKIFDENTKVYKNYILNAKWEIISSDVNKIKYVVKFNSDGGNLISSQEVFENEKVTKPTNPIKNGYSFVGWYLGDSIYDFSSNVNKDIELVAKWKKISSDVYKTKYIVKFNSDGGNLVSSQEVFENEKVTKPTNPTKNGYSFVGWYLGDSIYDFSSKVNKNIELVAKWESLVINPIGLNLNYDNYYMFNGDDFYINATVLPNNATNKYVEWSSSNPNIATVSDGYVKTYKSGEVTITAKIGNYVKKVNVTVLEKSNKDNYINVYILVYYKHLNKVIKVLEPDTIVRGDYAPGIGDIPNNNICLKSYNYLVSQSKNGISYREYNWFRLYDNTMMVAEYDYCTQEELDNYYEGLEEDM